jgi:peptidoglycan hydrolase FlgJ
MPVTIPSDLVAGVLKAAAPRRVERATLKLGGASPSPGPAAPNFLGELLALAKSPEKPRDLPGDMVMDVLTAADPVRLAAAERRLSNMETARLDGEADAYRKFEAMLLGNAFESILPPADGGAFGDGFAGGIWRSMAAAQIASLFADRGGIGIAAMLGSRDQDGVSANPAEGNVTPARQWPYFQTNSISTFQA